MTRTIRIYRERYTVEDDGAGGSVAVPTRETEEDIRTVEGTHALLCDDYGNSVTEHESPAREAVGILTREYLTYGADGGAWFGHADARTVDYSTGEEERVTAHLDGFTETETRAIIRMMSWLDARQAERTAEYMSRTR